MRQIKFRGLRTDGKGWVYGGYFQHTPNEDGVRYYIFDFNESAVDVIHETVGQFTGLLDKNGTDIWEGDICKVTYYNHIEANSEIIQEVVFTDGGFALIKVGKLTTDCVIEDDRTFVPLYYSQRPNSIEVIGNIHTPHDKGRDEK